MRVPTLRSQQIESLAGDFWNHLENLREHWQDTVEGAFIQQAIDEYEQLTGMAPITAEAPALTEGGGS